MPRFVLLQHATPPHYPRPLHWDFMLERGEQLMTWALAAAPEPLATIAADRLPDHRLAYLDYEGPVSGDRGHVGKYDAGTFEWMQNESGTVVVRLSGRQLKGRVVLQQDSDPISEATGWVFSFHPE